MSSQTAIILNKIINYIIKAGATRLHLEVGSKPVMRVDRQLKTLTEETVITSELLQDIVSFLLPKEKVAEFEKNKSIILTHTFEGRIRFKIHIFYQKENLSLIFTYIPSVINDPASIGLTSEIINLVEYKHGLIVIGGFQGSGRTSTVLSLLNYLNINQSKYILTLENPIEYILTPQKSVVEQREIGRDVPDYLSGLSFASDSDVDVVFLSEIKDYETLKMVYNLISAGRLVLVIIEAHSAAEAVNRLVDLAPHNEATKVRDIMAEILLGVVVQQLLPRRGGGQINVTEILITNPAAVALIKEGRYSQLTSVIQMSRNEGMRSLDQALLELLKTGEIEYEAAFESAVNKDEFKLSANKFKAAK